MIMCSTKGENDFVQRDLQESIVYYKNVLQRSPILHIP